LTPIFLGPIAPTLKLRRAKALTGRRLMRVRSPIE
jgi:hypothetical protein